MVVMMIAGAAKDGVIVSIVAQTVMLNESPNHPPNRCHTQAHPSQGVAVGEGWQTPRSENRQGLVCQRTRFKKL
jgi:hypothetical protein